MTPEVRLSPDSYHIAVMTTAGWSVTCPPIGTLVDDAHVSDWTPLRPASSEDGAE